MPEQPPVAAKIPTVFHEHGTERQDDYYWLREIENPATTGYLAAENAYYDSVMAPLNSIADELYDEMVARIPPTENTIPLKNGDYYYYCRNEKELEYPIQVRKRAQTRAELSEVPAEVILDVNALAIPGEYLDVGSETVSDDGRYLAYLVNRDGSDKYTCYVKDLTTGELLPDVLPDVGGWGSIAWASDGKHLFYVTVDETQQQNKLWRHQLGTPIQNDDLLFEETDDTFTLSIRRSRSGRYIFVNSTATITTETSIIDAENPLGGLRLFQPRQAGVEYSLEHWQDAFLVRTNEEALNFKLLSYPLDDFTTGTELVPYDETLFIESIQPFQHQLYISGRSGGLTQLWRFENSSLVPVKWDTDLYFVEPIWRHQSYDNDEFVVAYESLATPVTYYAIDLNTNELKFLEQHKVSGKYDAADYTAKQIFATASDGAQVPIQLVYRNDALANGPAPLVLTAYGAYGMSSDPCFTAEHLPILDKGVILATAQVRGGSEYGRSWYYDGRMQQKRNTFTDFIAAAKYLIAEGYTAKELLAGYGASAGGLLIGSVANMAGDAFEVLVAEAPFVDAVTTMLDETIPLTTEEWDEWGNPAKEQDYRNMLSYSPYDNVSAQSYPAMYVTTGINDPRVGFWEPAKWVAKLRELKTDHNTLVLKTNMDAGHYGSSGRLSHLKEYAQMYAFVLTQLGMDIGQSISS